MAQTQLKKLQKLIHSCTSDNFSNWKQGRKQFMEGGFELTNVTKGRDAWKQFADMM